MRALAIIGAVGLMTFGLAAQASATTFSLNPSGASLSASGPTSLSKSGISLPCTSNFSGSISTNPPPSRPGSITGATFTGSALCGLVTAGGLPWTVTATSLTTVSITNVTINTPIGNCGPGTLTATLTSPTTLSIPSQTLNPGGCTVSGTLTLTSSVSITSP